MQHTATRPLDGRSIELNSFFIHSYATRDLLLAWHKVPKLSTRTTLIIVRQWWRAPSRILRSFCLEFVDVSLCINKVFQRRELVETFSFQVQSPFLKVPCSNASKQRLDRIRLICSWFARFWNVFRRSYECTADSIFAVIYLLLLKNDADLCCLVSTDQHSLPMLSKLACLWQHLASE